MRLFAPRDHDRLDLQDPRAIERLLPAVRLLRRWFSYEVRGIEHVPTEGPALLLLNHGPLPVDAPLLGAEIYERFGRLPRALTDHLVFRMPLLREAFVALGAVDGRHEIADELLERGNLVIIMPGGAPEAFKSTRRAYELYWRERMGFARLAVRHRVPVIPAACIGIDELYTVPFDMFELGQRLFGVRSLPLPLLWGLGPLPRPIPLLHLLGPPLLPLDVAESDEDAVLRFRDTAVEAMEALLQAGLRERHGKDHHR